MKEKKAYMIEIYREYLSRRIIKLSIDIVKNNLIAGLKGIESSHLKM